uniref:Uncharacterized protein n=1 Tax=Arundo donax TaxID=35708 RepID=A0A0A8Z8K1_ARUDO
MSSNVVHIGRNWHKIANSFGDRKCKLRVSCLDLYKGTQSKYCCHFKSYN